MFFRKYIFIAFMTCSVTVQADDAFYAQATASATNVYLGQVFNVDVIVRTPRQPPAPELSDLPDFNAVLLEAAAVSHTTNMWLYRFAFRARQKGELTIPSLRFGNLETAPLNIHARKPVKTDRMTLTGRLSAREVYVGEPVLLTTEWDSIYPFSALKAVDFHFPILDDRRFDVLDLYAPGNEDHAQATGLPVHGTRVLAERRSYENEGTQHQSLSFSKILVPGAAGRLTIPASTLLCAADESASENANLNRRTAFQYPAYFDNTFFDRNVTDRSYDRIYTESDSLVLEVKPLPAAGRPALFNGLVGEYSIEVEAEPKTVRVGDAITLTVTVTSAGFMENITLPPLRDQSLLASQFEIPSERALPARTQTSKIYTQTVRPLSTSVSNVPPLELSYFHPVSNAYMTVCSPAIPLTVTPSTGIAIYTGGNAPEFLEPQAEIQRAVDAAHAVAEGHRITLSKRAGLLLSALLTLLAAAWVWTVRRRPGSRKHPARRPDRLFRRQAMRLVHGSRTKRSIYGELDVMLRVYLGHRLHLNPGALTFREVEGCLAGAGVADENLDELRNLFMCCEAYRFTRDFDGPADAHVIVLNAVRIVQQMECNLKRGGGGLSASPAGDIRRVLTQTTKRLWVREVKRPVAGCCCGVTARD